MIFFYDTFTGRFQKLDEQRLKVSRLIASRNLRVYALLSLVAFTFVAASFENFVLMVLNFTKSPSNYLLNNGINTLLKILAATLVIWFLKQTLQPIISSILLTKKSDLLTKYQQQYTELVFESIGDFLHLSYNFKSFSLGNIGREFFQANSRSDLEAEEVYQALYSSGLMSKDFSKIYQGRKNGSTDIWSTTAEDITSLVTIDDHIETTHNNYSLTITELQIKNFVSQTFKGIFIEIKLPHTLQGETFIETRSSLKKSSTLSRHVPINKGVFTTERASFEWAEFNKDLYVRTSDQVEARHVLTPDFMFTLHEWWNLDHKKIRSSFIKDKLCLLIPIDKATIGMDGNHKELIDQYPKIESLMLSIWYTRELLDLLPRQLSLNSTQKEIS